MSINVDKLNTKLSNKMAFKTRARWFEFGEKPNKYFLNLNKKFAKQKIISKITCEGKQYTGQKEVTKGITQFYKDLYNRNEKINDGRDDDKEYEEFLKEMFSQQKGKS